MGNGRGTLPLTGAGMKIETVIIKASGGGKQEQQTFQMPPMSTVIATHRLGTEVVLYYIAPEKPEPSRTFDVWIYETDEYFDPLLVGTYVGSTIDGTSALHVFAAEREVI